MDEGRYEVWVVVCAGMQGIGTHRNLRYEEHRAYVGDSHSGAVDVMQHLEHYTWDAGRSAIQPTTYSAPVICAWMIDTDPSVKREFSYSYDLPTIKEDPGAL